ncbi:protein-disulfide isomerase [Cenarchaeum symbiosum A]|uniref:Protein-disulfide isomerase n=1 Tax=Cenarchaeum symbiosum (strain A) TaxID=414004 RepID=A0RW91_CENSY|nr:protein-disulfide isomerase [Cenarchaeum symbiosum A]
MELHGPSVGIGAGVTAAVIVAAFFALDIGQGPEAELRTVQPQTQLALYTENGSPPLGDPGAAVTLVEFGDYQCFYCNQFFHDTEQAILDEYVSTGKVRMIFKDFTIIGPDSVAAAHGARCADEQGSFWEYHDILYSRWAGENTGWASAENLLDMAGTAGLDVNAWGICMDEGRHEGALSASNNDARSLGLTGTPAFFVIDTDGGVTKIEGARPYADFKAVLDSALA